MSFKDNFSRGEEEDMLEYDDGAFFYFSMSLLTFIALPYTYYLFKSLIFGDEHLEEFKSNCKCTNCVALVNVKKRQISANRFTRAIFFRCLVGAFLWYIWYLNFLKVSTMKPLQSFDPFAILDLPSDATVNDIKKKFRKMSLLKHPDKNPDNPLAVQEFIKLTKAYNVSLHHL
jgi:translocation protein SEC63